jgi:putative membrane protein
MWWFGDGTLNGWGYALMTVSMVLFWGLVIYGVVWLVRSAGRDDRADAGPSPEDLLAERFARGEIDEPEYRQRLGVLEQRYSSASRP